MAVELAEVEQIFSDAVALAIDQRALFLDRACADNRDLRTQVESLLRAHDIAGTFLSLDDQTGPPDPSRPVEKAVGSVIGRYKLIKEIGEGGFGVVYLAEQHAPVRRHVALKIIKHGMDSRQVIARFEAERQALAILDHTGIAKVYDGGTTDAGRPYFVMELVDGVSLVAFCDQQQLGISERLRLFLNLCEAIHHAHTKGIIHRDLKPSNILVTSQDGRAVVKVIDFGVARATQHVHAGKTIFTEVRQLIGTPEYMSPEQAEGSLDIDTRSDVYALGVILYELLAGSAPFDPKELRGKAFGEMQRIIREVQPPRPSTRLSKSDGLPSIAANRQLEPKKLSALVHGELDWIVMKSLEKDRDRRYETANGFAMDVQRYLNDEAVQACPPSAGYRLRKFARRHRGPVLAGLVVVLALVGGIIGTTSGMLRATAAEADAVREAKQKDQALTDATDQLFSALVSRARALRSSGRIGQRFEALRAIRAAAQIRITPELRTEAIAALVLPDAEVGKEWERSAEHIATITFDDAMQRYVRLDSQGGVAVCRSNEGREEVVVRLPAHGETPCNGVLMSPDGRFVACGYGPQKSKVERVVVWKLDGAQPVVMLEDSSSIKEGALAFHPTRQQLALGHTNKSISIYDLATGRRVQRLATEAAPLHLAFHPRDGRLAAACGNAVLLFDTDTAKELPALRHSSTVTETLHVAWHPDGRRLAAGCDDRKIHIWDTDAAREVMSPWTGHTADGWRLAFNHAGDRLVSGDWSGQTRLWNSIVGQTLLTMPGVTGQFSSDDSLLGPEYRGNSIRLWRLAGGRELRVLRPRSAGILDNICYPVVHPHGRILAAGTPHQLCFFDLASGEELASVPLPIEGTAYPVFFDAHHFPQGKPDGRSGLPEDRRGGWMTGGQGGLILWPARQDSARPEVMRIGPPQQIAPNPGGGFSVGASTSAVGRIVAVPQGKSTLVLDRDRPERRMMLGPQYDVRFSAVSPDGHWVVTCSWGSAVHSETIRIWDTDTGSPVQDLGQMGGASAKFSPDGRWLMTGDASGDCRQWEVGTWKEVRRFEVGKFAFTPDSRLLAISDVQGVIRLLETTTGREVARLTGPEPMWYFPVCFTPDGTRLVAIGSNETAVYVWDLRLIRQQLKELGLDWEWPDYPPEDPASKVVKPLQVEVDPGDLNQPAQKPTMDIERFRLPVEANPPPS